MPLTSPAPRRVCVHCGGRPASRPRGLCWSCFDTPTLREQYPASVRRGVGIENGRRPPPEPTAARPGSPEKIVIMAMRAERGEALFHPADAD